MPGNVAVRYCLDDYSPHDGFHLINIYLLRSHYSWKKREDGAKNRGILKLLLAMEFPGQPSIHLTAMPDRTTNEPPQVSHSSTTVSTCTLGFKESKKKNPQPNWKNNKKKFHVSLEVKRIKNIWFCLSLAATLHCLFSGVLGKLVIIRKEYQFISQGGEKQGEEISGKSRELAQIRVGRGSSKLFRLLMCLRFPHNINATN